MMTKITSTHSLKVNTPSDKVWSAMRRFGDLSWAAGIEEVDTEGEGIGMIRKVRLTGQDNWILERLTLLDEEAMRIAYEIENDGLDGLANYAAECQATPEDQGCIISWTSQATVENSEKTIMQDRLDFMVKAMVQLFAMHFT